MTMAEDGIDKYNSWIRANFAIEIFLKEALLYYLHNKGNDRTYKGLPEDKEQLCAEMETFRKSKEKRLSSVVKSNQWDILCTSESSQKWDITLICAVITNLPQFFPPPTGGWKKNIANKTDKSKSSCVIRARNVRNDVKHSAIDDFQKDSVFKRIWKEIKEIVACLGGSTMISELRDFDIQSLEKFGIQIKYVVEKIRSELKEELSKEKFSKMEKDLEDLKDVVDDLERKYIENMKDQIMDGVSLLKCSSTSLQAPLCSVKCSGDIENYTKWPLICRSCEILHGCMNIPIKTVQPGEREGFAMHKNFFSFFGCWMKCSFTVGFTKSYLHLMVYQPYSYNTSTNRLNIAITGDPLLSPKAMWNQEHNHMQEASTDTTLVHVQDDNILVVGSMATGPKSTISIKVYPRSYPNLVGTIRVFFGSFNDKVCESYEAYLKMSFEEENTIRKEEKQKISESSDDGGIVLLGIKEATYLRNACLTSLHMKSSTVSCVGSIENFSKWNFICKGCDIIYGYTNVNFEHVIEAGSREVFASHSRQYFGFGSRVKFTYSIENDGHFMHVMYSLPQTFEMAVNQLAIIVSKQKHDEIPANAMLSSTKASQSKFYGQIQPVVAAEHCICIVGTMGTSHKTEINLKIYPVFFKNLYKGIKAKAEKLRVTKEKYEEFIRLLQNP